MSETTIGYLSTYEIHDGEDPGGLVKVGEVVEFSIGEQTADRVEVTHMESPDRMREFIAGMIDPGEASFTLNWIPGDATDLFLRGLRDSGAQRDHKVTYPNGVSVTYTGAILSMSTVVPIDDRMQATVTVARSGGETWAAAV